ncbi:Na/Pi cotransporter family protein [Ruminococcus gauvreauii]|uniref:Na/Pi cotransporter family protein n=1 Tax=Ruminococcus gauvreauii TaxID=438033 RepID=A0ABY5VGE6_9FIRM|nr:Na/Pi cotransporter family protein [Ruminococcus gauvreauii]UWP59479.1 Na/Pi cotransporter family protein [Ruminococcus gauvreauii]
MEISDILILLGGLALFLYGMQMMSNGLEMAAGNKMKRILEKLTANRIKGVVAGAVITAVIQSSSATTVMVVGFVNSGLMTLNQAVWVIMGANIGTTITGQLIALDIGVIAPLIAFLGVATILFVKNEKAKHISEIFAGLGVLFIGMDMMGSAMVPLQNSETFIHFMTTFSNPLIGILIGAVFTAIIQSSSASVGILQALASTGMIPLSSAVYILFGQNIGTCITAVLASIGTKVNAKRTTVIHLMFNIIGTIIFTVICLVTPFTMLMEHITPDNPVAQIANVHTVFNIVTTLLLLPFGTYMARLAEKILPDKQSEQEEVLHLEYIQPFESHYAMGQGALVLTQIDHEVERMRMIVRETVSGSFDAVLHSTSQGKEELEQKEEYIDYLNAEISRYIVSVMHHEMAVEDSIKISGYYKILGNLERIGDHAMNVLGYAVSMKKKEIVFSDQAKQEIMTMKEMSLRILDDVAGSNVADLKTMLEKTSRDEQKIDDIRNEYLTQQIERIGKSECIADAGIFFSEMLTDFERIGDHALNIAEQYYGMLTRVV